MGFNGFPQGIKDNPDILANRADKLKRIIHAEMNALLFLTEPAFSLTMYVWPMLPCHRCAVHIIQSGIMRVVSRKGDIARWEESTDLSKTLFKEAGVDTTEIEDAVQAQATEDITARRGLGPPINAGHGGGQRWDYDL
jgi:dCMP deaminase